jgi:peroxiredoxin
MNTRISSLSNDTADPQTVRRGIRMDDIPRMNVVVRVGGRAPDFYLEDQHGKIFRISGVRGSRVLLAFFPQAWTEASAAQLKVLEAHAPFFEREHVVAVGISADPAIALRAWAEQIGIQNTPLLSDFWPHGQVARLYGVFRERDGIPDRAVVILDGGHRIVFAQRYDPAETPAIDELLDVLRRSNR